MSIQQDQEDGPVSSDDFSNVAIRQAWSNRSGVVASPGLPTGISFEFNCDPIHQINPGSSLPNIRAMQDIRRDQRTHLCASNCQSCCNTTRLRRERVLDTSSGTALLSPVVSRIQRSPSPPSSYGSVCSEDFLLVDEEIRRYRPGSYDLNSPSKLEASVQCGCHIIKKKHTSRSAYVKLIIASIIALLFMSGEVIGGYFAGSLAIMTDAAHMLSDLAGFLISLFAIWVGSRPPSRSMSFGWHRAEVLGALVSVLIVWVLTGVLVYEAVQRVINPDLIDVKPDIMLITACIGVFVNVFMCAVLGHGHGHSHGGDHGHSHRGCGHSRRGQRQEKGNSRWNRLKHRLRGKNKQESVENINIRAAFVHVIGDLIQSIGVVIAGYIIWFRPDWKLADPVCTFLFCVLVLLSTINVLKDALRVLMEGAPSHIDYEDVKTDLEEIDGVKQAHSLHIWSLTTTKTALSAHLAIKENVSTQHVLDEASKMLRERHNIGHTTLQVENFQPLMNNCSTCQRTKPKSTCCWPC